MPALGDPVTVGAVPEGVAVLHAGTRVEGSQLVSAGGRVVSVTAVGDALQEARDLAYEGVAAVSLRGSHWRTDIARDALTPPPHLPR